MTGFRARLAVLASRSLSRGEREAVWGDLEESGASGGQALRDVLGLVFRRQVALWSDWRAWLALVGFVGPAALLLSLGSAWLGRNYDLCLWIFRNYEDIDPATLRDINFTVRHALMSLAGRSLLLACSAWISGFVLGRLSRRTVWVTGALFCLVLLRGELETWMIPRYPYDASPPFSVEFYSVALPLIRLAALVLIPWWWGVRQSLRQPTRRLWAILWAVAILIAVTARSSFRWPVNWPVFAVYWPVVYMVASSIVRLRRRRDAQ